MADNTSKNPPEKDRPKSPLITDPRQAAFLYFYYYDRHGPAYANGTKAAELAGFKGEPGSNQLAVQAHRLLRNPKIQQRLVEALEEAGCTPELIAQRVREALDATKNKYFRGTNNQLIPTPPQPDHGTHLRTIELIRRLMRDAHTPEPPTAPAAASTTQMVGAEELSPENAEEMQKVAALSAPDRLALCAILDADERLANEAPEQEGGEQHDE